MMDNLIVIGEATEKEPAFINVKLTVPENENEFLSCLEKVRKLPYLITSTSSKLKEKKEEVTEEDITNLVDEIDKSIDLLNSTWRRYHELIGSDSSKQGEPTKKTSLVQLICFWGLSETTEDLYHAVSEILDTYKPLRQYCFWGFSLLLSWRVLCSSKLK